MNKGLSEKNENNEKQFLDFSYPHSVTNLVHTIHYAILNAHHTKTKIRVKLYVPIVSKPKGTRTICSYRCNAGSKNSIAIVHKANEQANKQASKKRVCTV